MGKKTKIPQVESIYTPQGRDLFQTPNYAVDLLIPFLRNLGTSPCVWECAAGKGKIAKRLEEKLGCEVFQSDIVQYTSDIHIINFLTDDEPFPILETHYMSDVFDCIITNPPFSLKKKFYKRCLMYGIPFALLIPADYSGWIIDAIQHDNCERILPSRRIDYITPSGLSGKTGQSADFHSMWLTGGLEIGKTETFLELTKEMKENI